MPEQEENILLSDDGSIVVTTLRIIQSTQTIKKEIPLKEIVSTEIIRKFNLSDIIPVVITALITLVLFLRDKSGYNFNTGKQGLSDLELARFFFVVTGIGFVIMNIRRKKLLVIKGSYNTIEFSVKRMAVASINNFIQRLHVESNKIKSGI